MQSLIEDISLIEENYSSNIRIVLLAVSLRWNGYEYPNVARVSSVDSSGASQ